MIKVVHERRLAMEVPPHKEVSVCADGSQSGLFFNWKKRKSFVNTYVQARPNGDWYAEPGSCSIWLKVSNHARSPQKSVVEFARSQGCGNDLRKEVSTQSTMHPVPADRRESPPSQELKSSSWRALNHPLLICISRSGPYEHWLTWWSNRISLRLSTTAASR